MAMYKYFFVFILLTILVAGGVIYKNRSTTISGSTETEQCLISVDGSTYDVTKYRYIHDGGDVFKCGTDMSKDFHSEHPASFLQKMAKYKIK